MATVRVCVGRRCCSFKSTTTNRLRHSFSSRTSTISRQGSCMAFATRYFNECAFRSKNDDNIVFPRRRSLSTQATFVDQDDVDEESISSAANAHLLHPDQMNDGIIPYPKALSPSAIMEFKKCPQSFLFQYLWGLKQPTSMALAKGSMCHSALEKVFDLDPQERTLNVLQDLFRSEWSQHRLSDNYRILFENANEITSSNDQKNTPSSTENWDLEAEREWGQSALQLLKNYYDLEDPKTVVRPNPIKREIWLNAHLSIDAEMGVTAAGNNGDATINGSQFNNTEAVPTFHVRGIVDRLDMVRTRDSDSKVCLRIVDYKTGKAPNLKYSPAMNQQIMEEAFFQLRIYALLLREKGAGKQMSANTSALDLRLLRLLYLTSEAGKAVHWDMDLGSTQEERDAVLQETHKDLSNVWMNIVELVSSQDPKAFVGCDRSFCYCHKCRERFIPGVLWEPASL